MAAAIPAAIQAGGAITGGLLGRRSAQGVTRRGPEEQQALTGATTLADLLGRQGGQLFGTGLPFLQRAGQFFGQLVGGNRAALQQAVAPERAGITDLFRGARRRIEAEGRGGTREQGLAELAREEAGQLGLLLPRIRTGAAGELANLGLGTVGAGQAGTQAGAGVFGNLLGLLQSGRLRAADLQRLAGKDLGGFLFDILMGLGGQVGGRGGRGGGVTLPGRQMGVPSGGAG